MTTVIIADWPTLVRGPKAGDPIGAQTARRDYAPRPVRTTATRNLTLRWWERWMRHQASLPTTETITIERRVWVYETERTAVVVDADHFTAQDITDAWAADPGDQD